MTVDYSPRLTRGSCLALEAALQAQRSVSDEPDELMSIVVHQVQDLWFNSLLNEVCPDAETFRVGPRAADAAA